MKTRRISAIALILIMVLSLAGCSSSDATDQISIAQNDWAGGFLRLAKVQNDVAAVTNILDTANYEIIMGNPTDYWSNEDYHYLHFMPVYDNAMALTYFFSEEYTLDYMQQVASLVAGSSASVNKIDTNHYTMSYQQAMTDWKDWTNGTAQSTLEIIYDASHMWMQMVSTSTLNKRTFNDSFYEFAELSEGKYAVQTNQERLYVVYDKNGEVSEFYHSVLPDVTSNLAMRYIESFNEPEYDKEGNLTYSPPVVTEKVLYTVADDSIYNRAPLSNSSNPVPIGKEWVEEAGDFKSQISYKDNILTVIVTNALTGEDEGFSVEYIYEEPEPEPEPIDQVEEAVMQTIEMLDEMGLLYVVIGALAGIVILYILIYIFNAIGRMYVMDRMGASHPKFAWIPILGTIVLGYCAANEDDKVKAAGISLPVTVVAFHPIITIALCLIPYAGLPLGALVSILFKGGIYTALYKEFDEKEHTALSGYLSGVIGIIATVKFMRYRIKKV